MAKIKIKSLILKRARQKTRPLVLVEKVSMIVLSLFLVACMTMFYLLSSVIRDPNGMAFTKDGLTTMQNSRIFDSDLNLVYEFGEEIRQDVTYDEIPQVVVDALLSIEDSRFFVHTGFDLSRFVAAAMSNLRSGTLSQGGSTLTMQMIDNAFTSKQQEQIVSQHGYISKMRQIKLKIQEIYLSLVAEKNVSKEAIFEYYVNRVWFGSGGNTRGIQKAAQYFFNKNVSELNLTEAAFLAGAVNAPNEYNPMLNLTDEYQDHLVSGQRRRNVTLDLMLSHGYITKLEHDLAVNTKLSYALEYSKIKANEDPNEAYIAQVVEEVEHLTGQDPSIIPMDIYTALNSKVQSKANDICEGVIVDYPDKYFDVGFAVLDNATGEIIAVGPGRTYHTDAVKIDASTDRKQPGSSMKPILAYSSTFDLLGWSTEHEVVDEKKDYWKNGTYVNNSDGEYNHEMSLAYALGVSKNTTAAQAMLDLIDEMGTDYWIEFLQKCGYDEDVCQGFNEQYSIGGSDMWASPIQQASAYSMFANEGNRIEAHRVRKVVRRSDGEETLNSPQTYKILSSGAAYMMSYLLYKVVNNGYYNLSMRLKDTYPVYGKSGTSDWGVFGEEYGIPKGAIRDMWSIGYTNAFTIACWSGYSKDGISRGLYIPTEDSRNYAVAFDIVNYLLDYCKKFADYDYVHISDEVREYERGWIKKEFYEFGDTTNYINGTRDEDEEDEDKEEEEEAEEREAVDDMEEDEEEE
ncbi:MAG: transglycosylase domain-containing protein [Bacillota bacterium]|nr:transglycosylase domain-containing protein [Bacillota bacterium]